MRIRESYDAAAEAYAEHLADELDAKPLDRHLLDRFAEASRGQGTVLDLGCGPGHVARYLSDRGVAMEGIDLSAEMIRVASRRNPELGFRVGDMTSLDVGDGACTGAVLFYSLVHFEPSELAVVLGEVRRVLTPGGLALIAFHVGDESLPVDELFGAPVSLEFRFFPVAIVCDALLASGFRILERTEREPYEGAEYPSRRCYLLAEARA